MNSLIAVMHTDQREGSREKDVDYNKVFIG